MRYNFKCLKSSPYWFRHKNYCPLIIAKVSAHSVLRLGKPFAKLLIGKYEQSPAVKCQIISDII